MNTTPKRFLDNPNFVRSVELLLQLIEVNAREEGQSAEAEAICDEMDAPWYALSEAEHTRLRVLSANLDMLIEDEVFRPVPPEQRTKDWLEPRLTQAREAGDWDAVLALLRNGPDYRTPDELAYERSIAYRNLGHCEIALMFADYAYKKGLAGE